MSITLITAFGRHSARLVPLCTCPSVSGALSCMPRRESGLVNGSLGAFVALTALTAMYSMQIKVTCDARRLFALWACHATLTSSQNSLASEFRVVQANPAGFKVSTGNRLAVHA